MKARTIMLLAALSAASPAVLAQGGAGGANSTGVTQSPSGDAQKASGETPTRAGRTTGQSEVNRSSARENRASTPNANPPGSAGVPTTGGTGATTDQENNH
jgi:hypothetical protein